MRIAPELGELVLRPLAALVTLSIIVIFASCSTAESKNAAPLSGKEKVTAAAASSPSGPTIEIEQGGPADTVQVFYKHLREKKFRDAIFLTNLRPAIEGTPTYLVDPAINGVVKEDAHGNKLTRYDAPKATLMSYIIKGVLGQDLPWGLVLIGAMIAIMLEIVGVPSLAFAVGLYLPIATSAPIFFGGMVRKLVDVYLKRKLATQNLTEEQIIAETDKSHGVLLASGYIAGGAIAGILIAIFAVQPALNSIQTATADWAKESNPFFAGDQAWWLGAVPFLIICVVLYMVGRELWMRGPKSE